MGSRGAYEDVDKNNFTFKEGKQLYHSFAIFENVKMLTQASGAVKAPEISHTENRIYAITPLRHNKRQQTKTPGIL